MLPGDQGTLVSISDGTFVNHPTNPDGTMLQYGNGTMVEHGDEGTMLRHGDSTLGREGEGTMVTHGTGPGSAISR